MRIVFLLCAAFALGVAAGPVEEMIDLQQNMQPEEKPDEFVAVTTDEFEREETVPVVEEEGRMPDDVRRSRNICTPGWSKYGSRCFIFISKEMPWIDAEKYCTLNGANLASIHNTGEYDFIQQVVRGSTGRFTRTWIGGTDAIKDRTWLWSDGSGFNFYIWGIGQPDNLNGYERCLEMNYTDYHLWNDVPCEVQRSFVCGTRP